MAKLEAVAIAELIAELIAKCKTYQEYYNAHSPEYVNHHKLNAVTALLTVLQGNAAGESLTTHLDYLEQGKLGQLYDKITDSVWEFLKTSKPRRETQIFVKNLLSGINKPFKADLNAPMSRFFKHYSNEVGIPSDQLRFIANGRQLNHSNDESLAQHNIHEGTTLCVLQRITGD